MTSHKNWLTINESLKILGFMNRNWSLELPEVHSFIIHVYDS